MKLVTTVKILSKAAQMAVQWPRSSSHCQSLLFLPPRHLHLLFACDRISLCKTRLLSHHNLTPTAPRCWYFLKILMSPPPVTTGASVRTCLCPGLDLLFLDSCLIFLYLPEFFLNLSHLPSISLTQFLIKTLCPLKMSSLPFSFNSHLFFSVLYMYTLICL